MLRPPWVGEFTAAFGPFQPCRGNQCSPMGRSLTRCRHWRSDSKFSYTEPVQRRLRFQCLHALEHNFRLCSRIALHQEFIFFV
jgi:hypothetical protein